MMAMSSNIAFLPMSVWHNLPNGDEFEVILTKKTQK